MVPTGKNALATVEGLGRGIALRAAEPRGDFVIERANSQVGESAMFQVSLDVEHAVSATFIVEGGPPRNHTER